MLTTLTLACGSTGGTAAYVLSVVIVSPRGEVVQLGGYQNWYQTTDVWSRSVIGDHCDAGDVFFLTYCIET